MKISEIIDARGMLCPLPVLKLRKRIIRLPANSCAQLLADDPAAVLDVPHFCQESGHEFISMTEADSHQVYIVRRKVD